MTVRSLASILVVVTATAAAAATPDHLQCFKIKDTIAKTTYTADLVPSDTGFPVAPGCTVKLPAKILCVDVEKTNVAPTPPGTAAGPAAPKYLCYKVKCPKAQPTATVQDQFGIHPITVKSTSLLCAPVPLPTTTTTTTTSTTSPCIATPEVCDGVDNDCDGFVDEGLGTISCGVGQCQNTVPACVGGSPQTCTPGTPGPEICGSGIDEDCDGIVDEQPCQCTSAAQCPTPPNAVAQCQASNCTFFCLMGYSDCNNFPGDGCEVNVQNDPANCGSCGNVCVRPNATTGCMNAMCTIASCNPGFADCNGAPADGCETSIFNNNANCGGCNLMCPGATTCVGTVCQ